jgi:uncharacterized radical SAM superfamily Fe-S cluster-containing enzyme
MDELKVMWETESLCPVCTKKLDATIVSEGQNIYMIKTCSEHGAFKTKLWEKSIPIESWLRKKEKATIKQPITEVDKGCPFDCGLCSEHKQHTCTALIEVTQRCNLKCKYCFADSEDSEEPNLSLEEIENQFKTILKVSGKCNIQLSGGEPTLRKDLAEIVKMGIAIGFHFIQVNTNGIRLGQEETYARELKEAGVASVFLQFDGTTDSIYEELRGKALYDIKIRAIENCKKYGLGVILVPTLVPGVNIHDIGNIIKIGLSYAPTVRGVHFQPVSYFGRVPFIPNDEQRITLPQVMEEIQKQTGGMVSIESMKPPGCENQWCSFHGDYIIDNKKLKSVTKSSCCSNSVEKAEIGAIKAKEYVARNWTLKNYSKLNETKNETIYSDWDRILNKIHQQSFTISAMAFQDIWNVDLERIKECCIHVATNDGRLIPFCMYNITNSMGKSIYRN